MADIRNQPLLKKFFDFFDFKSGEGLNPRVGEIIVPVAMIPLNNNRRRIRFRPTEAEFCNGISVPAGKRWRIIACFFPWVADVNAGNRELALAVTEVDSIVASSTVWNVVSRNFQIASTTVQYSFLLGTGEPVGSSSGTFQSIPLPDIWIPERSIIFVFDNNGIAAGDAMSAGTALIVEEEDLSQDDFVGRAVP